MNVQMVVVMEYVSNKMKKTKKGGIGLWILIILILIALGVGIYFLLGSGGIGGSGIPSPPGLPS